MSADRLDVLLDFHRNDPDDTFILFALAKEYEKQQSWQEAREKYDRILSLDPKYLGVFLHLGKVLEVLSLPEEAMACYEQGIAIAQTASDPRSLAELMEAKSQLDDQSL